MPGQDDPALPGRVGPPAADLRQAAPPLPAAVAPVAAPPGRAPASSEGAYATTLLAAQAATPALPEPLAWAVLALAEMVMHNTKDRGNAPAPVDTPEELHTAMQTLAAMGRHRLPIGGQLAQLAVDAFADAWLWGKAELPFCAELDGEGDKKPPPPFSLLHIVSVFAERLPPAEPADAKPPPPLPPPDGVPVFMVAPSLLGRYRQLGSCNRFLHAKTEFSKRHNVGDGGGGGRRAARNAALLKDGSATEAVLQKGMYFEAALTELISREPPPACLAPPLRLLPKATRVRDLALEAFRAAVNRSTGCCACGHTEQSRLGADLREKRHANPDCAYSAALLEISKRALLTEVSTPEEAVCLYQAKFEVPRKLYTDCVVDPDVLRFTNFQPDYVYILPGEAAGMRELAIVDAKASAHVKVAHRVQVAAYAWALDGLMEEGEVRATSRVADLGAIWRPGCAAPDVFALEEPKRQHVEALKGPLSKTVLTREAYLLSLEKPSLLASGQDWQLRSSCASCEFLAQCRKEAVQPRKLASVPGMGPAAVTALRELTDINDIEDVQSLADWLRDPATPAVVKAATGEPKMRRAVAALAALAPAALADAPPEEALYKRVQRAAQNGASPACAFSPRLAAALEDRVRVRPGSICTALPAPQPAGGKLEDIVCVSLLSDPTTGEAYAWAVQTFTVQPGQPLLGGPALAPAVAVVPRKQFDAAAAYAPPPPPDELERLAKIAAAEANSPSGDITLSRGLALRRGLVAELHAALCGPDTRLACAVMLDGGERAAVLRMLFEVATSGLAAEADLRVPAQCCLFACLDARLLAAENAVGMDALAEQAGGGWSNNPADGWPRFRQIHKSDSPSMAALLPALPMLLELPALGFFTLSDVARHVAAAAPALQTLPGGAIDALRDFIIGPEAELGRSDSLEATVAALDGDAAYRDWGARAVGGEFRVAELVARRCRLAAATLDGLRALLDAAGGAANFLPLSAAVRGAALQVQPFDSAACARSALFKCMELRAGGAANRAERARPLAARLRKDKTLLVRVTQLAMRGDSCTITVQVVPEAEGGAPDSTAEKLLGDLSFKQWLLAPLTRDGLLSTLRFPESALAHVGGYVGRNLWEAFPPEERKLRASLRLGALGSKDVKPGQAPGTLALSLALGPEGGRYSALQPASDCAVGTQLLLCLRETDTLGPKVAQYARAMVDCPRGGPAAWLHSLMPNNEVVVSDVTLPNGARLGDCVALFVEWDAHDRKRAKVQVTASNAVCLKEAVEVRVPESHIRHKFSLFRTLFDPGAEQGVMLPDFNPAVVISPAGAWACGLDCDKLKPMTGANLLSSAELDDVLATYARQSTPTASQRASFERVVRHRLSAVWGPPGAGKTHFSAGMLHALFAAYTEARAPLRVLVCAATKAATRVLLRKLSSEAARLIDAGQLESGHIRLFTTEKDGLPADEPEPPVGVEKAPSAAALWGIERCVVGSTVWQASKLYSAMHATNGAPPAPKFDLILVDEASQLLACDAMLVVDLLDPFSGRLVVVGDHLQMPPVIRGTGYPAGTAGCPSPAASLLEAVRGALKAGGSKAAEHATSCTLLDNHRMAPALAQFCAAPEGIYPAGFRECSETGCPCRRLGRERKLPLRADAEALCGSSWLSRALNPAAQLVVIRLPGADDKEEARVAAALMKRASECWAVKEEFCADAFVVAPHHRQIASLTGELAREAHLAKGLLSISTVETVQGREAELVVILYALSDPDAIAAEADFLYGLERLNVALTRARQKAVLLLTRAVASPDARAAAAAASPAADEGLAFLRRAASFARRRGWYIKLRRRDDDSETEDGADGGFEVDDSPDSDAEGTDPPPDPPAWPGNPIVSEPRRLNAANSDDGDDADAPAEEDLPASDEGDEMEGVAAESQPAHEAKVAEITDKLKSQSSHDDGDAAAAPAAPVRSPQPPLFSQGRDDAADRLGWGLGDVSQSRSFPPPSSSESPSRGSHGAAAAPCDVVPDTYGAPGSDSSPRWGTFQRPLSSLSAPPKTTAPPESAGFSPRAPLPAAPHTEGYLQRSRPGPGAAGTKGLPAQRGPIMFETGPPSRAAPVASPKDEIESDSADDEAFLMAQ